MNNCIIVVCVVFESSFHWESKIEEKVKSHNEKIMKRSSFILSTKNNNEEENDEKYYNEDDNEDDNDNDNEDGYCSGDECEYHSSILSILIDEKLYSSKNFSTNFDDILCDEDLSKNLDISNYIVKLLPKPVINNTGSGYCSNSLKSSLLLMDAHEYRYTLIKVEKLRTYPPQPQKCYC